MPLLTAYVCLQNDLLFHAVIETISGRKLRVEYPSRNDPSPLSSPILLQGPDSVACRPPIVTQTRYKGNSATQDTRRIQE